MASGVATLNIDAKIPPAQLPDLSATYGASVLATAYGAVGDGTTDDKSAIDAALAVLSAGGTLVFPGGKTYKTSGGHAVPVGVTIRGSGATIIHTGNNVCFKFNQTGAFNLTRPSGLVGLRIVGNPGVAAVAVELGNAWGLFVHASNIQGYTAGVGILLNNVTNWCEGTSIDGVMIGGGTLVGIKFQLSTGTSSFAYTKINDLSINVPGGGIGIDIGSGASSQVYLYNSDIRATTWILGPSATGVVIGANTLIDSTRVFITGEIPGGTGSTTGAVGVKNLGGTLKAYGHINIKSVPSDLTLGFTRVTAAYQNVDSVAGVSGGDTFQGVLMDNPDVSHNAMFGYISGSNRSIPFVSSFDQADSFRVYSVPYGSKPSAVSPVFFVTRTGAVYPQGGVSGIFHGTGNPEGAISAQPGSIYLRSGGSIGATVWIKDTGTSTTGWKPLTLSRSGTTAARPTVTVTGLPYFDETLGKPIWWGGSAWKDATGATV